MYKTLENKHFNNWLKRGNKTWVNINHFFFCLTSIVNLDTFKMKWLFFLLNVYQKNWFLDDIKPTKTDPRLIFTRQHYQHLPKLRLEKEITQLKSYFMWTYYMYILFSINILLWRNIHLPSPTHIISIYATLSVYGAFPQMKPLSLRFCLVRVPTGCVLVKTCNNSNMYL